ncbi:MAG: hypothetical protein ACO1OB_23820 [Archangium sp.]
MTQWPTCEALSAAASLPNDVTLRAWREDEVATLPSLLRSWFPTVSVGAESVFLDETFLRTRVFVDDSDFFVFAICQRAEVVGFQAFERQVASQTLHGRLGVLAPEARAGFLGALGFPLFEALGRLIDAELLLVWVTLATKGQQLAAERRGFVLSGLVPSFDVDLQANGRAVRVMEALYAKPLVEGVWPSDEVLTPHTRRVLAAMQRQAGA